MIELTELVEEHRSDFEGKSIFTAFSAGVPVYRLRASLLVREAVELDPIDMFLLRGISKGLDTLQQLVLFFGLDQDIVESSIANMLHNEWVIARPVPGQGLMLTVQPTGKQVLAEEQAVVEQTRDAEIWVDGLTGHSEIKRPRVKLLQPRDAKARQLVFIKSPIPSPKLSSEVNFAELEQAVAQSGPQLWPGTRLALLLDVLNLTPRGTGYRAVQVLTFQGDRDNSVEFEVFDAGTRNERYERILRRLELERNVPVVPTQPEPSAKELAAYEEEIKRVRQVARSAAQSSTGQATTESESRSLPPAAPKNGQVTALSGAEAVVPSDQPPVGSNTTQRLRSELRDAHAHLEGLQQIIDGQALVRNYDNRLFWKRVLMGQAVSYVVMEFPWVNRDAIDDEMLTCFTAALKRKVKLWIAWGLEENGPAGRGNEDWALQKVAELGMKHGKGLVRIEYRGNTHRKVLLWDGAGALIGSFNFGSFRGDPKRRVREEICVLFRSPREIADLAGEYQQLFGVESLA